ncbi:DUF2946 domain-containing protein [Lonsdalea quercina]|uniref:DUF2946 domain-containing protein n=1 Tax=Lonsdalea quercina TaxID=71657 RepID=UPI0039768F3D
MLKRAMSLFELRRKSGPYWLGIFAVIIIFISPVVSQLLARCHDARTQTKLHHRHVGVSASMHGHAPSPSPASHDVSQGHSACGYCVLFLHLPALQPPSDDLMPRTHWHTALTLKTEWLQRISEAHYPSQLARAPPCSFAVNSLTARSHI